MNEKGGTNRMFKARDFTDEFLPKLKKDKTFIDELVRRWDKVRR